MWVHSRYERQLADAAVGGREVRTDLSVRRLYCENPACPKQTSAEQVPGLTVRYQRRTPLLQQVVEAVDFALYGDTYGTLLVEATPRLPLTLWETPGRRPARPMAARASRRRGRLPQRIPRLPAGHRLRAPDALQRDCPVRSRRSPPPTTAACPPHSRIRNRCSPGCQRHPQKQRLLPTGTHGGCSRPCTPSPTRAAPSAACPAN
ncbi:hypothetical protein ACH4SP_05200 [Streptomyces sp. NPDC021093]|uniref:hypothetical protein n=1 Tax=Streptomyces sp. NPDC021093 TaxID=3365112 RepID=UPI003795580C